MARDWAITSRRVLTEDGLERATVVIAGERIKAVLPGEDAPGLPVVDVGSLVVMPGLVDCHVHINEPGRTAWEGFETATRAAASGGITTVVDMPLNCIPVTTSVPALHAKLTATRGRLWVDAGFWGGVVPGNAEELAPLARAGVLGCKAFLIHSGIDDFPNVTESDLRVAMRRLAEARLPLLAHAELDLGAPAKTGPASRYSTYLESRPAAWEDAAIALLIRLCRETGCAVHIVHLSSAGSLPQLRSARAEDLPVTVETCPHYLCLRAEDVPDGHTHFKCAPPIRGEANREALWQGLLDGDIDLVVSDHSPCTPQLKLAETGDFEGAWGGIASLQLGLPSLWTEARDRNVGIETMARWMTRGPARIAGLGQKGRLAPGCDADLVVWDPDASFVVEPGMLHFRHKISPYVGKRLFGRVRGTYLRGDPIFVDEGAPTFPSGPLGQQLLHRALYRGAQE